MIGLKALEFTFMSKDNRLLDYLMWVIYDVTGSLGRCELDVMMYTISIILYVGFYFSLKWLQLRDLLFMCHVKYCKLLIDYHSVLKSVS